MSEQFESKVSNEDGDWSQWRLLIIKTMEKLGKKVESFDKLAERLTVIESKNIDAVKKDLEGIKSDLRLLTMKITIVATIASIVGGAMIQTGLKLVLS